MILNPTMLLTVIRTAAEGGDAEAAAWLRGEGRIVAGPNGTRFVLWNDRALDQAWKTWRRAIFQRDRYICQDQDCGQRGGALNAHHIESWAEAPTRRYDLDNGVTLCVPCHAKRHPRYRHLILSRG